MSQEEALPHAGARAVQVLGHSHAPGSGLEPHRGPTQRLAGALRVEFGWLPTACPELNPTELLWRDGKQRISANRTYDSVDEQALLFTDYLRSLSSAEALTLSGVRSGNFWLPT